MPNAYFQIIFLEVYVNLLHYQQGMSFNCYVCIYF